jgi:uncharacterized delta-60 repeat protein
MARLNADGTLDHTFMNGLSGADGRVDAIAVQSDGKILIGDAGGARIARLNADGTLDGGFQNRPSGVVGGVSSIDVQSDGKVLIGGDFTQVNDMPAAGIARLNADGSLDRTFQIELAADEVGGSSASSVAVR